MCYGAQNKRSYFWYWPGCEVEIRGHRPTFCSSYHSTPNPSIADFATALQQAIEVLHNDTADLAGVAICASVNCKQITAVWVSEPSFAGPRNTAVL